MSKVLTWGSCLDFTMNNRDSWRNGNGRKSALLYAGMFTEFMGLSYPIKNIDYPLMVTLTNRLKDKGLQHASINRFISAVSVVLKFTKDMRLHNELLDFLPFPRFKERETNRTFYTRDQVKKMVEFARTQLKRDDLADVIQFTALTGMRINEVLHLPAKWVNYDLNVLALEKCKWGKARTIPIHPELIPILKARTEYAKPNTKVFGDEWNDDDQLRRAFYKCTEYLGLLPENGYVFHSLRYSFGTWHMASGTPPIDVQNMLGHSSITTTLGYCRSTNESQQKHTMKLEY